eukprot:1155171-Pelagomonas_calceolata.AAC.2
MDSLHDNFVGRRWLLRGCCWLAAALCANTGRRTPLIKRNHAEVPLPPNQQGLTSVCTLALHLQGEAVVGAADVCAELCERFKCAQMSAPHLHG